MEFLLLLIMMATIAYVYMNTDRFDATEYVIPQEDDLGDCYLKVHFFSAPTPINWKHPLSLLVSSVRNFLHPYRRKIGHVSAEFYCKTDHQPIYFHTSMTDRGKNIVEHLLVNQIGMGIILQRFKGRMEDTASLQEEYNKKTKSGRVQTVTIKLPTEAGTLIKNYIQEYRAKGLDQYYSGLQYKVRDLKGTGCFAFVYGIIEVLQLENDPIFKSWLKTYYLPKTLIGSPADGTKVSLLKLIFDPQAKYWGKSQDDSEVITIWDLDLVFELIKKGHLEDSNYLTVQHDKSVERIYDRSQINIPEKHILED
jgi:hypothetical protein